MKISTRQYLKDLRKAEERGRAEGYNEAYEDNVRSKKDGDLYDCIRRLNDQIETTRRLQERVEQLGRMFEGAQEGAGADVRQ